MGDAGVFLSLPVALWWLWPEVLRSEGWFILAVIASYAGSASFATWKFGRPASYHTWLGKTATLTLTVGAFIVMLGWARWPFRAGLLAMNAAIVEEIAISLMLREPCSNLPSWWHARRGMVTARQGTKQPRDRTL